MTDQIWQVLRYLLIAGGAYLAGKGKLDPAQVTPLADAIVQLIGLLVSTGAAGWGLYVRWRTAAVPAATAARPDVPTVSAATGAVTS